MEETKLVDPPETIPIRPDEDFDHDRLAAYLRGKLPGSEGPLEIVQFAGGHANLTYLLRYGSVEYVLRRPPLGPVAPGSHDMAREYRCLSVLYQAYPLAPRAYLFCEDPSIIGASFFVMERRYGTVVRRVIPEKWGGGKDPVVNRKISEVLIDALADLHAVDPASVGLDKIGKPEGFLARQVDGWMARFERAKTKDLPIAREVHQWLQAHMPASPRPTLLHNDWRLDNMMLADDDPGRCVAVFDWDMCTVGDPLCDLGTLLTAWVEEREAPPGTSGGPVVMPSNTPGFMTRAEAVARYGKRHNVDVSNVPYYYVFGLFKMAVVVQQIYYRYHVGQTKDERFRTFGQAAEFLFHRAHEAAQSGTV